MLWVWRYALIRKKLIVRTCPKCGKKGAGGGMTAHIRNCGHDSAKRFWSFVDTSGDGCWPWIGAGHRDGYGRANVRIKGKTQIRSPTAWRGCSPTERYRSIWTYAIRAITGCAAALSIYGLARTSRTWPTKKRRCDIFTASVITRPNSPKPKRLRFYAILLAWDAEELVKSRNTRSDGVTAEVIYSLVARRSWKHIRTSDIKDKS